MTQAEQIVAGLGGSGNIVEIEACTTRLRITLHDTSVVDERLLRAAGAHGIIRTGRMVQVVVGPVADTIASELKDLL